MTAIKDINKLVSEMTPILNDGTYVFVTVKDWSDIDKEKVICSFKEKEGLTLVLDRKHAETLNLNYESVYAWITLSVHSSLEAVGFTAVFSTALGENNISCNVIAGYYHDHLFVKETDASKAMDVLQNISSEEES